MKQTIIIHYTLLTRCKKTFEVEVEDEMKFSSKKAEKVYRELIQYLPEEEMDLIEEDEVYDFVSQDFGGIDGIEIISSDSNIVKEFLPSKKYRVN